MDKEIKRLSKEEKQVLRTGYTEWRAAKAEKEKNDRKLLNFKSGWRDLMNY